MTLAVVDDREVARQQELREREREVADAVKTQDALLLLVRLCSLSSRSVNAGCLPISTKQFDA